MRPFCGRTYVQLRGLASGSAALQHHKCTSSAALQPRRTGCSRTCGLGIANSLPTADTAPDEVLSALCQQFAIRTAVQVAKGQWGLGLFLNKTAHALAGVERTVDGRSASKFSLSICAQHQTGHGSQQQQHLLVSVPLHLVLSCTISGCSPTPHETPAELHHLLHSSCCSKSWELQVAALLLWALRQPSDTAVGGFWQSYAANFLPSADQQQSLLLWSQQELLELQDKQLTATAVAWQRQVADAYVSAVKPCFDAMYQASCLGAGHGLAAAVSHDFGGARSCSLEDWIWAVATVESRAFGVSKGPQQPASQGLSSSSNDTVSGASSNRPQQTQQREPSNHIFIGSAPAAGSQTELVGLVPILDLANHTCSTNCHHSIDQHSKAFELYQEAGVEQTAAGGCSTSSVATGLAEHEQEVLITYGEKDNRRLMEQYGFCIPDNPVDRVMFPKMKQNGLLWMSYKAVKHAADHVKQQLQQAQHTCGAGDMPLAQTSHRAGDAASRRTSAVMSPMDAVIFPTHVDAALASVVAAAGWKNLRQYKQVTASSTIQCAEELLSSVQGQLQAFPTSLQEDLHALKQGNGGPQSVESAQSGQHHSRWLSAVQYRLQQKLLLSASEQLLVAVIRMQRTG